MQEPGAYDFVIKLYEASFFSEKLVSELPIKVTYLNKEEKALDNLETNEANDNLEPLKLVFYSPKNGQVSSKKQVLFKGLTEMGARLEINGQLVDVSNEGKFFQKFDLNKNAASTMFAVSAVSGERLATASFIIKNKFEPKKIDSVVAKVMNSIKKEAKLNLYSPESDFRSKKSKVLFKGDVDLGSTVLINGDPVETKQGRFYQVLHLTQKDAQNDFTIEVIDPDGLKKVVKRKIYFENNKNIKVSSDTINLPEIYLDYPAENQRVSGPKIIIKGRVKNAVRLSVDNVPVRISKDGSFSHELILGNSQTAFIFLKAESALSKSVVIKRKIRIIPKRNIQEATQEEDIQDKLDRKIALALQEANVTDVIRILAEKSGLNIVVDQQLGGKATLKIDNVSIQDALNFLCDTQGLTYKVIDNTLLVGSKENMSLATQKMTTMLTLTHINVEDAAAIVSAYIDKSDTISILKKENKIFFRSDKHSAQKVKRVIEEIESQKNIKVNFNFEFFEVDSSALPTRFKLLFSNQHDVMQAQVVGGQSAMSTLSQLIDQGVAKRIITTSLDVIHDRTGYFFEGEREFGPFIKDKRIVSGISINLSPFIQDKHIIVDIEPKLSLKVREDDKGVTFDQNESKFQLRCRLNDAVIIRGLGYSKQITDSKFNPMFFGETLFGRFGSKKDTEVLLVIYPQIQ